MSVRIKFKLAAARARAGRAGSVSVCAESAGGCEKVGSREGSRDAGVGGVGTRGAVWENRRDRGVWAGGIFLRGAGLPGMGSLVNRLRSVGGNLGTCGVGCWVLGVGVDCEGACRSWLRARTCASRHLPLWLTRKHLWSKARVRAPSIPRNSHQAEQSSNFKGLMAVMRWARVRAATCNKSRSPVMATSSNLHMGNGHCRDGREGRT
ncbi:hypothetical protein L227DRAFT_53607 [Lentinus tigrinus ALCF2SS1-6]|uniref:Uncharacterized protein n=1 Tax=Lentinus tigrinus ALCF2SS1-6 TaxID=1328759 RepID=A0A5C2SJF9_9APHY|nr:hypothetical protein L227DRAFT_53607 [Lentinus tigrinus ALCF2SS1-6]